MPHIIDTQISYSGLLQAEGLSSSRRWTGFQHFSEVKCLQKVLLIFESGLDLDSHMYLSNVPH